MVITTSSVLINLNQQLEKLSQEKKTGELILKENEEVIANLYFCAGRLLYATKCNHRVRRFNRAIKKNCPKWNHQEEQIKFNPELPWEYQLIFQAIKNKKLALAEIKAVITQVCLEIFFELNSFTDLTSFWKDTLQEESVFSLYLTLSYREIQSLIEQVEKLDTQWRDSHLNNIKPNFAVYLTPGNNGNSFPVLLKYFQGAHTLWDIALELKKTLPEIGHYLSSLASKNVIKFKEISDLTPPFNTTQLLEPTEIVPEKPTLIKKGLIACIDDSPVVAHNLKKILAPLGYDILTIEEPMRGFGTLIENKPDLIFLDLNMPNANGYSVCQFLRNSPVFHKTPIVILTAHDTAIDRTRAKLVGATDFLGKPAEPKQVVKILEHYLKH